MPERLGACCEKPSKIKELAIFAGENGNALIAETSERHLLALPLGHELTQNVTLFPVRFGLLFRQRNVKYLFGSRRKVFQYFLSILPFDYNQEE